MKKILLVDDEAGIRNSISRFIRRKSSYKLITAEDGETALDKIRDDSPDLIVLDVMMPGMDGLSLLYELMKSENLKDIPVILISGKVTDEDAKKTCLDFGAVDYLVKPFEESKLLEIINSILERD